VIFLFILAQALCEVEDNVYIKISEDWQSRPVHYFMEGVSFISHPGLDLAPPLLFYTFKKKRVARDGLLGVGGDLIAVYPLKFIINRQRPSENTGRLDSSFPSGHTTFTFTQAVVYSHHYPRLKLPLYLYAGLVGFSRIYLGKHYPTDVIGGALLGIGIGIVVVKLFD